MQSSGSKQQIGRHEGVDARQLKLEVSDPVPIHIALHEGSTADYAVAQLPGHTDAEGGGVDHREGLVTPKARIGVNSSELNPVRPTEE